jgi:TonB family protein
VVLAAAALAVIYLLRVRTAAARHAVWAVVTAAMLLLPALGPLLPSIPLRVLRAPRGVQPVVEAASNWTFRPAYQDGKPVDYPATVTMSFHLVPAEPLTLEIARKSKSGPQDAHQVTLTPDPTVIATTKSYFIVSPSPGVTLPQLVYKTDPQYSEQARNAKFQGTLTLTVNIGTDGMVHGVRVSKSLGLGQDEKGIEAVRQWKFQPAYEDGKPIPYTATVQLEFRLI